MYRLFKIGLVVAAAFAFTVLMVAGALAGKAGLPTVVSTPISHLCAYLIWPGMAITVAWLHTPLGDGFFSRVLFFNTLIYSVLFGLISKLLGFIRRRHESED